MPNIQLADNLRYLRKQRKLTQNDLSEILNISRQAYSNYENSKRTPDLDSLLYLAQYYRVNLNDLVLCNMKEFSLPAAGILAEGKTPSTFAMNERTGNSIYLTDEETKLLTSFRALSREKKQIITGFLNIAPAD